MPVLSTIESSHSSNGHPSRVQMSDEKPSRVEQQLRRHGEVLCEFLEKEAWQFAWFADVVLKVGKDGAEVPTSRFLLCAYSALFKDLFGGYGREALQPEEDGRRTVIPLEELDGATVESLVAALLTGKIEVTADGLEAFCKAVDFLQFQTFKDSAKDIAKNLDWQEAVKGRAKRTAFLTHLVNLGDCYNFPAFIQHVTELASKDPNLVKESIGTWPASAIQAAWERFC